MNLLGVERIQFVDELVEAFDDVATTGSPQWWSLEAPPGWGKTRLVQELFERLAARQGQPGYWPTTLAPFQESIEGIRKRVAPDPASALRSSSPEYFWWGLSCMSRPGSEFEALVQDLGQFAQHEEGLERRWRQLVTRGARWRRQAVERRGEIGESVLGEGVSWAAGAANLAVPGLGLLLVLGKWGVQRGVHELRESRGDLVVSPGRSIADELGPELERLGAAGLPLVVVLEDAHAADGTLVELLARLMVAENSRVLLITTSWPGLLAEPNRSISVLRARVSPRVMRGGDDLPDLDPSDRAALARSALATLDEEGSALLAARYANPLALQTACRLGAVRRSAARGALTQDVLRSMPKDATGLYDELWRELPPAIQLALILAVLSSPASIGSHLSFGDERWDPVTVATALVAEPSLLDEPANLLRDLAAADDSYAWVTTVEVLLQRCDEPAHRDVALSAALTEFAAADRSVLHVALARALLEADAELEPARRQHADRLLLTLAAEGALEHSNPLVLSAASRVCARLVASPAASDQQALLEVAQLVGDEPRDHRQVLEVVMFRAAALAKLGRVRDAVETYRLLLEDQVRVLGAEHPHVLSSRNDHAVCLARSGRVGQALELLEALKVDRSRLEGPDGVGTLATRGCLATWLGEAGRISEALAEYERLAADRSRVFGPLDPDTLRTRSNLAWWLGEAGRIDEAVLAYERLLPEVLHVFGPDAPDTLTTGSNLANWLGEAGRIDRAVELLEKLVLARTRILGSDVPDTLRARANLAWWIGAGGGVGDARARLKDIYQDRVRVLGADAPDTLRTRSHLAWFAGQAGEVASAVSAFETLLVDQLRVLGDDSPDVTRTRDRLRHWHGVLDGRRPT